MGQDTILINRGKQILLSSKDKYAYKLIIPALIIFFISLICPLIFSLFLSFYKWKLTDISLKQFIFIKNYVSLLSDSEVIYSLIRTLKFTTLAVGLEIILGIGIALLLNLEIKGRRLIRVIILIPMMLSDAVVALMWRLILNLEQGILNYLLSMLGITPIFWLGKELSLYSIIFVEIWMFTPFVVLLVLASLQAIPQEIIEASKVDGANSIQRFFRIIFPMIRPVVLVALIFRTIFALRCFSLPWVLTGGGPANATNFVGIELYRQGFIYLNIGKASALSWILVLITMALALLYIKSLSRESIS